MTEFRDELTLDELLRDPLTQAVMKADRVDPPMLEAKLRSLAREISGDAGQSERTGFGRNSVRRFLRSIGLFRDKASGGVCGSRMRSLLCGAR